MANGTNSNQWRAGAEPPTHFNFASDVVDKWAEDPDKLALICVNEAGDEHVWTFAKIAAKSNQLAQLLQAQGLKKGDRVIVMLPRIAEWQLAMTALLRMGCVPIPCITMLTAKDLEYRVAHSGAAGVVARSEDAEKFAEIEGLRVKVSVGKTIDGWTNFEDCAVKSGEFVSAQVAADDLAILYYTSGSTGDPKGVAHGSRALWAWANSAIHWLGLSDADRIWCTADTGWSKAGTSILFGPWSQGSAVLFYDGPFDPQRRIELLKEHDISVFCAAATELRQLVLLDIQQGELPRLRRTVSAGESVNPEIIGQWKELTGTTILDGYGQTETLMTVTNRPDFAVKGGSMGRALPDVKIALRTPEDEVVEGEGAGELLIGMPSPQIMLGYWNDPERTQANILERDGRQWFCTGDNIAIDADGYAFYSGRSDDIINSSGYRIGPQEVENALAEHPAVQECAVAGISDDERGELVKAWIILKPGHDPSDDLKRALQDHTKAATAPYKYPRAISFVSDLPKTTTGKIQRNQLREGTWHG